MIKVEQQEVDKGTGDCMRASIASILETDLQAIPHLTRTDEARWFSVMYYFFIAYEFVYAGVWWPAEGKRKLRKRDSINGFYLVTVKSRTYPPESGITHMVVMGSDWKVAHDPHPDKKWQGELLLGNPDLEIIYKFRKMNDTDKRYWHYVN
jgi:hypothetical protein